MKLNSLEFMLMNNPIRAASQRWIETLLLFDNHDKLIGKRVLEVGCGRGVGIEILLSLNAHLVIGFDLDPRMVVLARKRVSKYGNRAGVFVGNAEAIDLPDASFDIVVDYGILHHVPDWQKALMEITRILTPGGIFFFEDILKSFVSAWPIRNLFDHPQATQFTGQEFRQALEKAGLNVQKWRQLGEVGIVGQAGK